MHPPRRVWGAGVPLGALAFLLLSLHGAAVKLLGGRIPVLEVCSE